MIIALILAGGTGSRVGLERPKQFIEIFDKPIIAYTTEIYQVHPDVDAIEIVCHQNWRHYLNKVILQYNLTKVKWIVDGGSTFQESVMHGINNLKKEIMPNDIIMLHYGSAPFTSQKIITDAIKVCRKYGMSVSCTPCYQLMGSNDECGVSKVWMDRDKLTQIACPQSFKYSYLLDIYKRAEENRLIEKIEPHTTSLMYALGDTLYQSYGDQTNIKITTKEDLELFKGYVLMQQN